MPDYTKITDFVTRVVQRYLSEGNASPTMISEGLSSVLYHKTTTSRLKSILEGDKLFMTSVVGTSAERKLSDKMFYVSFARSKTSAYFTYATCVIEFDGDKLSSKYHGHPVDYWQYDYKSPSLQTSKELEDRIFSDSEYIPNISKYIRGVSVIIMNELTPDKYLSENWVTLATIAKICKQKNIPMVLFLDGSRAKSFSFSNNMSAYNNAEQLLKSFNALPLGKIIQQLSKRRDRDREDPMGGGRHFTSTPRAVITLILDLYHTKTADKLKDVDGSFSLLFGFYAMDDTSKKIDNILSQNRTGSDMDRYIRRILYIMRTHSLRTGEDLFNFLKNKWSQELPEFVRKKSPVPG